MVADLHAFKIEGTKKRSVFKTFLGQVVAFFQYNLSTEIYLNRVQNSLLLYDFLWQNGLSCVCFFLAIIWESRVLRIYYSAVYSLGGNWMGIGDSFLFYLLLNIWFDRLTYISLLIFVSLLYVVVVVTIVNYIFYHLFGNIFCNCRARCFSFL